MCIYFKTNVAAAARSAAMEAVNHSKNSAMEADTISNGFYFPSTNKSANYLKNTVDLLLPSHNFRVDA